MIETNFQKLMNRSSDLLDEIRGVKSHFPSRQLVYTYRCYQVLAPENFKWDSIVINLYSPTEIPLAAPVGTTVVLHGHAEDSTCYTNTFCHILGYQPVGENKFWEMKWSGTYATTATKSSNTTKTTE